MAEMERRTEHEEEVIAELERRVEEAEVAAAADAQGELRSGPLISVVYLPLTFASFCCCRGRPHPSTVSRPHRATPIHQHQLWVRIRSTKVVQDCQGLGRDSEGPEGAESYVASAIAEARLKSSTRRSARLTLFWCMLSQAAYYCSWVA